MSESRHVWQTNHPENRILRVLDAVREAIRVLNAFGIRDCTEVRGVLIVLNEVIDALDAPRERYRAEGFAVYDDSRPVGKRHIINLIAGGDGGMSEADVVVLVLAALNAQERKP